MANKWLEHLKKFWSKNKGKMSYSQAMKEAKKTYKSGATLTTSKSKARKSTKGSKSKTHKGDKDYTTKKGDKDYHEKGKNVKKPKKPYKGNVTHGVK